MRVHKNGCSRLQLGERVTALTSPEIAYLDQRWAPITPVLMFAILYIVAREVMVNINMPYFLLIYLSASYSAWSWGKQIKNNQNL